jgi:3-oxoacyl-[acyl-carrier protein] reductase
MTNPDAPLAGKVAYVTGAARGQGRSHCVRLARAGADIVAIDACAPVAEHNGYPPAQPEDLAETVSLVEGEGRKIVADEVDVRDAAGQQRVIADALEQFGRLDIVVANAGLELTGLAALDFTEEQFDRMFSVNTKGAFFTMQAAGRHVADNGRIVYISSSTTGYPNPGYALHGSSKVAPEYLVRVLAHELGHRGIAVNSIVPTATGGAGLHTHVEEGAPIQRFMAEFSPMGRMGTPQDVADIAEFFAGDLSAFVSGQTLVVSGCGAA